MRSVTLVVMLGLGLMTCGVTAAQEAAPVAAVAALPEDQQATKEQIAKLFDVMRLRQQMVTMQKMMPSVITKYMQEQEKETLDKMQGGQTLTPAQQEQLSAVMHRIMEKAFTVYSADDMIADSTTVYQKHINREDADALIVFYRSPAGQHLLDAQPVIAQELMPMIMDRTKQRSQALAEEMTKEIHEIVKQAATN